MTENKITKEHIEDLLNRSEAEEVTFWDKEMIVSYRLPPERGGFTVTGRAACVDPENFSLEKGREIARRDAIAKLWHLEGYLLQTRLYGASEEQSTTPLPYVLPGGVYTNIKTQSDFSVVNLGICCETGRNLVVYVAKDYGSKLRNRIGLWLINLAVKLLDDYRFWVRPLDLFEKKFIDPNRG